MPADASAPSTSVNSTYAWIAMKATALAAPNSERKIKTSPSPAKRSKRPVNRQSIEAEPPPAHFVSRSISEISFAGLNGLIKIDQAPPRFASRIVLG